MLDDRLDDMLNEAARDYNDPPETPHEVMWARIEAAREAERTEKTERTERTEKREIPFTRFRPLRHSRPLAWAAGIAAILALGIGLGRLTTKSPPVPSAPQVGVAPVITETSVRTSGAAYQLAATEYLSQSEAFLTLFRVSVRGKAGNQRLASATARQLLATNRLLLDSPAATDQRTRLLLQDLELVLAEIAQLSPESGHRDLDLITEGLDQRGMMSRLRTAVPSGPSITQGAL
jgi:hypothetical protein